MKFSETLSTSSPKLFTGFSFHARIDFFASIDSPDHSAEKYTSRFLKFFTLVEKIELYQKPMLKPKTHFSDCPWFSRYETQKIA
jgi:hypothetical protein